MAKQNSGIDIPEGLDGVRHAYSMYLGGTGTTAIAQAVFEPLDNAFDECKAMRNDCVALLVDLQSNLYGVLDFGNGIPDTTGADGVSTLTQVFTTMHATGKGAGGTAYLDAAGTAGTHGVGLKVANAVCEYMAVITRRGKKVNHHAFSRGKPVTPVQPLATAVKANDNAAADHEALLMLAEAAGSDGSDAGTFVLLVPDNDLLTDGEVVHPDVAGWHDLLKTKALLNPGVTTVLMVIQPDGEKEVTTWCYEDNAYVPELAESYGYEYDEAQVFAWSSPDLQVSFVPVASGSSDLFDAYVSGRSTPHPQSEQVLGFRKALHAALLPMRNKRQENKPFTPASVLRGVLGFMNIDIRGARFAGQNKERLVQQGVARDVQEQLAAPLAAFFATRAGAAVASSIIANAIEQEQLLSEQARNRKALKTAKKTADTDCYLAPTGTNTEAIELFVVEGDSAGGNAKYARQCSKTQGVLKLRGKYLNCARSKLHTCASNKAINSLATAISGSMEALLDGKCRIGKLLLTSDADCDGSHINLLHLSLIDTLAPWLLEQGRVYVVQTPLYKAQVRAGKRAGDHFFAFDFPELEATLKREKLTLEQCNVTRFKGLGEMNAADLALCVFNRDTRRLLKIDKIRAKRDLAAFRLLVGADVSYRKRLLGFDAGADEDAGSYGDDSDDTNTD